MERDTEKLGKAKHSLFSTPIYSKRLKISSQISKVAWSMALIKKENSKIEEEIEISSFMCPHFRLLLYQRRRQKAKKEKCCQISSWKKTGNDGFFF